MLMTDRSATDGSTSVLALAYTTSKYSFLCQRRRGEAREHGTAQGRGGGEGRGGGGEECVGGWVQDLAQGRVLWGKQPGLGWDAGGIGILHLKILLCEPKPPPRATHSVGIGIYKGRGITRPMGGGGDNHVRARPPHPGSRQAAAALMRLRSTPWHSPHFGRFGAC